MVSSYVPLPTAKTSLPVPANINLDSVSERIGKLYPNCRIVLRKSGTEDVVRAYVEGNDCQEALSDIEKSLKI